MEGKFDWGGFTRNLIYGRGGAAAAFLGAGIAAATTTAVISATDYSTGIVRGFEEARHAIDVAAICGAVTGSLTLCDEEGIIYRENVYNKLFPQTVAGIAGGTIGQGSENKSGIGGGLEPGTLSNVDARKWYLEQEAKIPDLTDTSLPLEEQARQAFDLRNQFRMQARELMSDRQLAESLYATDPNLAWEQIIQKQIDNGLSGDDI